MKCVFCYFDVLEERFLISGHMFLSFSVILELLERSRDPDNNKSNSNNNSKSDNNTITMTTTMTITLLKEANCGPLKCISLNLKS